MNTSGYKLKSLAGALSLATLALVASPLASAQETFWYGGANAGFTDTDMNEAVATRRLQSFGLSPTALNADDEDRGFKALLGYQVTPHLAVEASMFDLGKYGFRSVIAPDSNLAANIRPIGYAFDFVGMLPFSEATALFARVGINYAQVREYYAGRNLAASPYADSDESDGKIKYGVGFQHYFSDNLGFRAEVERYEIDEPMGLMDNVNMYSVGVLYRFGAKSPTPPPVAAAPAPRAATPPPPPPPPATPPPPPAPTRITLMTDAAFDFDKATLKPDGRAELDKLISDLRPVTYSSLTVEGHTDRIGSEQYNQGLSERRAQTVRDYLVNTGNIPANKVNATGKGESTPTTRADQCANLGREALITCLAPDRRVEVEVVGTKAP